MMSFLLITNYVRWRMSDIKQQKIAGCLVIRLGLVIWGSIELFWLTCNSLIQTPLFVFGIIVWCRDIISILFLFYLSFRATNLSTPPLIYDLHKHFLCRLTI